MCSDDAMQIGETFLSMVTDHQRQPQRVAGRVLRLATHDEWVAQADECGFLLTSDERARPRHFHYYDVAVD